MSRALIFVLGVAACSHARTVVQPPPPTPPATAPATPESSPAPRKPSARHPETTKVIPEVAALNETLALLWDAGPDAICNAQNGLGDPSGVLRTKLRSSLSRIAASVPDDACRGYIAPNPEVRGSGGTPLRRKENTDCLHGWPDLMFMRLEALVDQCEAYNNHADMFDSGEFAQGLDELHDDYNFVAMESTDVREGDATVSIVLQELGTAEESEASSACFFGKKSAKYNDQCKRVVGDLRRFAADVATANSDCNKVAQTASRWSATPEADHTWAPKIVEKSLNRKNPDAFTARVVETLAALRQCSTEPAVGRVLSELVPQTPPPTR